MSHVTAITRADRTATVGGVKARHMAATLRAVGLDPASGSPECGTCVMTVISALAFAISLTTTGPLVHERRTLMRISTTTPTISIDIGGQTRIYQAFVTTARPPLDGPSTLTLHTANFADVAGFAANPIPFNAEFGRKTARIVLVDATELAWHRAAYRSEGCLFAPVDPHLIGLPALQKWLWHRLLARQPVGASA